ncbi:MAG: reverse transcriptase/maturase family protein [Desulfovibrionaceae bacterium]|nr:reverse transcriptase/maturase family protein [Desulfovibrionaceae bacterium]
MSRTKSLYSQTLAETRLWRAWHIVYTKAKNSLSSEIRRDAEQFYINDAKNIRSIQYSLSRHSFKFDKSIGIAKLKSGKKEPRPIIVGTIKNRIVQRAILDTLQEQRILKSKLLNEFSFGGISNRGVNDAIKKVHNKILTGEAYHIRSDIKKFFDNILRDEVINLLAEDINDNDFIELLKAATTIELNNAKSLGSDLKFFPLDDFGVAQGNCLSPFFGNMLLFNFDIEMNYNDIMCIRYIDDFIIIGEKRKSVHVAFNKAQRILKNHGLCAYDPSVDNEKSEFGPAKDGIHFLGWDLFPGRIQPNNKSRARLIEKIKNIISESIIAFNYPDTIIDNKKSFLQTFSMINNTVSGWGKQYTLCNNKSILTSLDARILNLINEYKKEYAKAINRYPQDDKSRLQLLGLSSLAEQHTKAHPSGMYT